MVFFHSNFRDKNLSKERTTNLFKSGGKVTQITSKFSIEFGKKALVSGYFFAKKYPSPFLKKIRKRTIYFWNWKPHR